MIAAKRTILLPAVWGAFLFLGLAACARSKSTESVTADSAPVAVDSSVPAAGAAVDSAPLPSINADRAMQYTRELVAIGPRPIGSENHKRVEQYIHTHLK